MRAWQLPHIGVDRLSLDEPPDPVPGAPATSQQPAHAWKVVISVQRYRQASIDTAAVCPLFVRNFDRMGEPMKMLKCPLVSPPATTMLIRSGSKTGMSSSGGAFQ